MRRGQMFSLAPRRPLRLTSTGIGQQYVPRYSNYNRNKAAQGAARGCQNIMGFPDGADQGEKS
jgi:hypothetical protein